MFELLLQNVKGLLVQPGPTFERLKHATLTESYQQYVILLIIYAALLGIVSAITTLMLYYDLLVQYASLPMVGSFLVTKIELFKPIILNWSLIIVYIAFLLFLFAIFLKGIFLH
ncbi:MAG: hypothetical protein LUQ50_13115, partial [Methanospirillum sp.]|uniref:hypothetical protein n=1 Tax=Methanospirillum sp. TaxID=45200 RepID=UPI00236E9384